MVHRRDCFTTAAIHGTAVIFRKQEASGDKWIAKYQCHCMEFNVHITQQTFETLNRSKCSPTSISDDFIVSYKG